jgi:hypothetical protein
MEHATSNQQLKHSRLPAILSVITFHILNIVPVEMIRSSISTRSGKSLPSRHASVVAPTSNTTTRMQSVTRRVGTMAMKEPKNFSDESAESFNISILGDLHLPNAPQELGHFFEAREQLLGVTPEKKHSRVVQLGDLGSYEKGWPGSSPCFDLAKSYLDSFDLPVGLILGNHDLEGDEFESDEANLSAWKEKFSQSHFWASKIGRVTFIGLSTVRFRSNTHSVHEVHIDSEQIAFLEETLQQVNGEPVVMFTHAPILGSGLKAVQAVHVKNRCAWLNHSSNADYFISLVRKHPNIKLWFSGHFHLSQSYPDSISIVGGSAFVLTGVIGDRFSRDGHRHSRVLQGNTEGFELLTMDHDTGTTRLDLKGSWDSQHSPEYLVPEEELLCDPSAGWLCSKVDCSIPSAGEDATTGVQWFNSGPTSMLSLQDGLLIEYDAVCMAPIGAVFLEVPDHCFIRLVDHQGVEVDTVSTDGSSAARVEMVDRQASQVVEFVERNADGKFYQIFQPNKWVIRKQKEASSKASLSAI